MTDDDFTRAAYRTAWTITVVLIVVCVIGFALASCVTVPQQEEVAPAAPRYLSEKQDAAMRQLCVQGCQVIPNAIWSRIEQILRALSGEEQGT